MSNLMPNFEALSGWPNQNGGRFVDVDWLEEMAENLIENAISRACRGTSLTEPKLILEVE